MRNRIMTRDWLLLDDEVPAPRSCKGTRVVSMTDMTVPCFDAPAIVTDAE
jgi:hypothetical protein